MKHSNKQTYKDHERGQSLLARLRLMTVLILISVITLPLPIYAGGYYITDKDGKVISEISEKSIAVGPTDAIIVFNDSSERKVFDVKWDAGEKSLIVKGDNVHLKIYSSGRIEKWTTIRDGEPEQYPIFIEPVVPILPQQKVK